MGTSCKRKITHVDQSYGGTPTNEQPSEADSSMSPSQLRSPISEPQNQSHRVVRRRLNLSPDLPQLGSFITAETRRKRKAIVAFGRGQEESAPLLLNRHCRNCSLKGHSGPTTMITTT
ncbi:unnamed protein product [Urochloa decumbens]|uniref:Uncharacterized protein n=1 Tax=Urochloa decumbens TaxID=240449 RepID=A0ABC8W4K0_9POAL